MALFAPRLRAQIIKELLCLLRDPKSRFVLIVPPIIQLLVFSFAATLELKQVDIAIYNRDNGRMGFELVQRLGAARFIRHLHPAYSQNEMQKMIDRREVIAAISIAEDFSVNLASQRAANVQILLDGRRANSSQILLGYLNNIISNLQNDQHPMHDEAIALRHWFNPNLSDRWYTVPGLGGMLVMFITLLVTALSIARERELGTFDQLLVSPCTPSEIIIAKIIPALLMGLLLGLIMAAAAIFCFDIPFTGSFWMLLASMLLFIMSIVGIGLMISSICNTQQQAILGTFSIAVPAVLVSGFATPVENMPLILQWIAEAIPLKHYLIILHGCFLKAMPPDEIFTHAWPMMLIALLSLSGAIGFVRGKLQ